VEGSSGRESGELGMLGGIVLRARKVKGNSVEAALLLPEVPLARQRSSELGRHCMLL
jgi:hypothetical protein